MITGGQQNCLQTRKEKEKEKRRAREKDQNRLAKKRSKFWLLCMRAKQKSGLITSD